MCQKRRFMLGVTARVALEGDADFPGPSGSPANAERKEESAVKDGKKGGRKFRHPLLRRSSARILLRKFRGVKT